MNDCFWYGVAICDGKCNCKNYLSMNSDEGVKLEELWDLQADEIFRPFRIKFAKENGFEVIE